ncbi:MAG: hypothetical protein CMJ59_18215 [Planctomycetaceae bacterium]|nr:hypothetical protein [Planctomycetaceae bacterium]
MAKAAEPAAVDRPFGKVPARHGAGEEGSSPPTPRAIRLRLGVTTDLDCGAVFNGKRLTHLTRPADGNAAR